MRSSLFRWDISLTLNMTRFVLLSLRAAVAAGSTDRPPFGTLARATSPVSSGEFTPGRVAKKIRHSERSEESHRRTDGYIFLALVVGYFAYAQYVVKKMSAGYFTHAQYSTYYFTFALTLSLSDCISSAVKAVSLSSLIIPLQVTPVTFNKVTVPPTETSSPLSP